MTPQNYQALNYRFRRRHLHCLSTHTPERGVNSITGTTLSVWTDTHSCPLVLLQGKHHWHPKAITVPEKHTATVILVQSGELILFVMRCLVCWQIGSRDSVTEYPIAGHLWLSMSHYPLTGHFMLTTACHHSSSQGVTGHRGEYKHGIVLIFTTQPFLGCFFLDASMV